jgi:hypothetical protein
MALLCVIASAADAPVAGKWNCIDGPDTGVTSGWTLFLHRETEKLTGLLTDGDAQIPLSEMNLGGKALPSFLT